MAITDKTPASLTRSQTRRRQAPEADALRMGCGWGKTQTDQYWVLVETTHGDSHPGSIHLGELANHADEGILRQGGSPTRYTCTDICDGIAQGTEGQHYSLPSREVMLMACEMHANAGHHDGVVFLSGCDKSLPAHLIAALRLNLPAIVVPGGVMEAGPEGNTLEGVGTLYAQKRREKTDPASAADFNFLTANACPSAGSCAFFGTAATMQLLSEAMGFALPGSALIPAHLNALKAMARQSGERLIELIDEDLKPRDWFTKDTLDNALVVHAATGGSSNALLHLAAMAREADLDFDYAMVNAVNRRVPFLLNLKPSGKFTADKLWYAGGVYRLLRELKDHLHLEAGTVTGLSVGENLAVLEATGFFEQQPKFLANYGGQVSDIIRPVTDPLRPEGGTRVFFGSLAPGGAVCKVSAVQGRVHQGGVQGRERPLHNNQAEAAMDAPKPSAYPGVPHPPAPVPSDITSVSPAGNGCGSPPRGEGEYCVRVFDGQEDALEAILTGRIHPGDAVVVRYEGPAASGMPEQFYVTEAIAGNPLLATTTILVTDGRFSGATRGPAFGHVCPEAIHGGPIALLADGDVLKVDVQAGTLDIIEPGDWQTREANWQAPPPRHTRGMLGLYCRHALPAAQGGGLSTF
ncbi:MAG: dihydroxy-acid dehydratase [Candidatus Melainabacteria bacterium]